MHARHVLRRHCEQVAVGRLAVDRRLEVGLGRQRQAGKVADACDIARYEAELVPARAVIGARRVHALELGQQALELPRLDLLARLELDGIEDGRRHAASMIAPVSILDAGPAMSPTRSSSGSLEPKMALTRRPRGAHSSASVRVSAASPERASGPPEPRNSTLPCGPSPETPSRAWAKAHASCCARAPDAASSPAPASMRRRSSRRAS